MRAYDLVEVKNYESGNLDIRYENLTSLIGCPKEVTGIFDCYGNQLTSLEGAPKKVIGSFDCSDNRLTSFEYFPKHIAGDCYIGNNKYTSFKDIDQHIEFIGDRLFANNMNIKSGYSDLFGIDGLQTVQLPFDDRDIQQIVNKYLPEKDLINFQDEIIKASLESYL